MIDWSKATKEDITLIDKIVARIEREEMFYADRMTMFMDVQAAHATCPLKLSELLDSPKMDFAHDIFGIARNINRETGEIENCFLPRYAA